VLSGTATGNQNLGRTIEFDEQVVVPETPTEDMRKITWRSFVDTEPSRVRIGFVDLLIFE
jgi:hypothetical protein